MKYHIWQVAAHWSNRWVVIRPNLTIVGYYRTFEQARRSYIGDVALRRLTAEAAS